MTLARRCPDANWEMFMSYRLVNQGGVRSL